MSSYIPFLLVSDIVRRIGISGFRNLGPLIIVGPEWVSIVFSDEVLKESGNNTAKYIEGLRLAALVGPSVQALNMLGEAAVHYLHSYFAFGIFYVLCVNPEDGRIILKKYLEMFSNFQEAVYCAEQVMTQIQDMAPTGQQLYRGYRILNSIPDCHLLHFGSLDVCPECFVLTYFFKIRALC
ncbi:unnamed protein product [Arabidopsis thaliana]|uniref:(thale cress) hypothetical protein n=1 Tax=Arabidopsis thaliana TaxID=3702 RepID=A0A7G2E5S1_ARATH|nr:unnamed protein product [Arabidopsis thaliana]